MRRAFKYRLYPNVNQTRELETALETLRRLYNESLAKRIDVYATTGKSISRYEISKEFTETKKTNPWYQRINRSAATAVFIRLDRAYEAFFRRLKEFQAGRSKAKPGFPRFKGRDCFNSIELQFGHKLIGDRLRIQFIGDLKVKLHRPVEGTIKTVSLKREANKWFVVFSCELPDVEVQSSANPPIGIDLGLSHFLTTSEGETIANPRHLKEALPEVKRLGRKIALKEGKKKPTRQYMKRGSKRRAKAKAKLAKAHARVANLRKEQHHQVASQLVRRFGTIAMESLDIKGMLEDMGDPGKSRSQRLRRSISDAAWGGFASILECKAESAGVRVVKVDPRGTTQQCSDCGKVVPKTLHDRWHECPHCGLSLDRDHNAARGILRRALPESLARIGPAGDNPGISSQDGAASAVTLDCPRSVNPSASVSKCAEAIKDRPASSQKATRKRPKPLPDTSKLTVRVTPRRMNANKAKQAKGLQKTGLPAEPALQATEERSLSRIAQRVFWE